MKRRIYLNEYNIPMDHTIFLPLVSGLLQGYAQTKAVIRESYEFMPFVFLRDDPEQIMSQYQNPAVAAFSASTWNMNLSLAVAKRVKEKFPDCLIVFGGPQVPYEATNLLKLCPFIDVAVRGEGEQVFADLLVRFLETRDFRGIPGISYRKGNNIIRSDREYPLPEDLDIFPSPYLEGIFDSLLTNDMNWQAIVETNRGCPFRCSFCFWSQGSKRYRFYSLERVRRVIDWCGRKKIKYAFCADSNFGMIKHDLEIANYVVETKTKYGFPEKFRACYGKNVEDRIFRIGKLFTEHDLIKGVSISRQSNSPEVLQNIGRNNINMSVYSSLQRKLSKDNIPTYTELILGLPGETYESFLSGIEEILEADPKSELYIYPLKVFPNTEMADPSYQERFGIKTILLPISEGHASIRMPEQVTEAEELVISTASMSVKEWKRAMVLSWVAQLLHSLKLGIYVLNYLFHRYHIKYTDFFEYIASLHKSRRLPTMFELKLEVVAYHDRIEAILQGKPRGCVAPDFSSTYWEPEEASYLRLSTKRDAFYQELYLVVNEYLESLGIPHSKRRLSEVVEYQRQHVPDLYQDYNGDKETFAREVVVYGRKSNQMLMLTRADVVARYPEHFHKERHMNIAVAERMLLDIKGIFDANGIKFWLIFGTFLGIYRDGGLILRDGDMDLAVYREDVKAIIACKELFTKKGILFAPKYGAILYRENEHADLYSLRLEGEKRITFPHPVYEIDATAFETPNWVEFLGQKWRIPSNPEKWLEYIYGKNWRIPDGGSHAGDYLCHDGIRLDCTFDTTEADTPRKVV